MQKTISGIELHFLVDELQKIVNGKIEQIYQPDEKEILIQMHLTGRGKKFLRAVIPNIVYLSDTKGENPEKPSGFCTSLRKYLSNARITEINQIRSERVLEIKLETRESRYYLIIELFSKGNVILCNSENIIISCLFSQKLKEREIKPNEKYFLPVSEVNIFEICFEDFLKRILSSKKESIVKTLATEFSIGGIFSEEICLRANIDKNKNPSDCTQEEIKKIYEILNEIINSKINAVVYLKDGRFVDVFPFHLFKFKDYEKEEFSSFNEAIDKKISEIILVTSQSKKAEPYEKEIIKLKNAIESQKKSLVELEKREKEATKKAESIYSNYNLIKDILFQINKAREKYSWKEITEKLKGHKIVKEINPKEKSIVIEIED